MVKINILFTLEKGNPLLFRCLYTFIISNLGVLIFSLHYYLIHRDRVTSFSRINYMHTPPVVFGLMFLSKLNFNLTLLVDISNYNRGWIFDHSSWLNYWSSFKLLGFLTHIHIFSIVLRLELWEGHFRRLVLGSFIYSKTSFDVCFRSLSCWNN